MKDESCVLGARALFSRALSMWVDASTVQMSVAICILLIPFGALAQTVSFQRSDIPSCPSASSLAAGDFNGDRRADIVVVSPSCGWGVRIHLNNGDGTFASATGFPVGAQGNITFVQAADFNGDGHLDLAVADQCSGCPSAVAILFGNGQGAFGPSTSYATGLSASSIAVADFNGDGKLDIATANLGNGVSFGDVSVLLNNGDGTFGSSFHYGAGVSPGSIATGDLDGNGTPDLVVADNGWAVSNENVWILLNNGDGTFRAAVNYGLGRYAFSVAVGDFNNDRSPDLTVPNYYFGSVSVLFNNGDATFTGPLFLELPGQAWAATVADLNRDGNLDLAVTRSNFSPGDAAFVFLGLGNGTFQAAQAFETGIGPVAIAAAQFNRDGKPDLATANVSSDNLTILINETEVPNELPAANAGSDQTSIIGESVVFDASASSDPDGTIVSYEWAFGDGGTASGAIVGHVYSAAGQFTVTLTVADDDGATSSDPAVTTVLTIAQGIQSLSDLVASFNFQQGIANSLDTKLENARDALEAANAGNRSDASNKLMAFINAVNAQRGKEITGEQADALVALAMRLLAVL